MRRLASISLLLALAGAVAGASSARVLDARGTVVGVTAGDALRVRVGGKVEDVRVLGVVAPTGCYAAASKSATRSLVLGKRVRLVGERGRAGAYVGVAGRDLGKLLLARGAAQADVWGARFARFASYVPVQQQAETAARGMWRACAADLSLTVDAPDEAIVGENTTYTITARNAGPLAAGHLLLEIRPGVSAELVSADSARATCAAKGWFATCSIDELRSGADVAVTLVLKAARPGTLSVRADVSLDGCIVARCGSAPLLDPNLENDEAAALTIAVPGGGGGATRICDPGYPTICIPPPPPDLNCNDIVPNKNFRVLHDIPNADDHHLDGNNDGIGCQFDDY